jgi:DNA repair protein RadC
MLLFYSIPYRDTKPLAKSLLNRFGSLGALIDTDKIELLSVSGVGENTAKLLTCFSGIYRALLLADDTADLPLFNDYAVVGTYLTECFEKRTENFVLALFLDNNMRLIAKEEICAFDYESAAVRSQPFVQSAIKHNASNVIIAHNHPRGPVYPTEGDRATNNLIERALLGIDVNLLEHYVVSGKRYIGFMHNLSSGAITVAEGSDDNKAKGDEQQLLSDPLFGIFSVANTVKDPMADIRALKDNFGSLNRIMQKSYVTLVNAASVSRESALLVRLIAALISRAGQEGFAFGKEKSETALISYLTALYFGHTNENVYLIGYGKDGVVAFIEYISEGSVNYSTVNTRLIIEKCMDAGVKSVAIAHNHPSGRAEFSQEDKSATATLSSALFDAGIQLKAHYLISGSNYSRIDVKID